MSDPSIPSIHVFREILQSPLYVELARHSDSFVKKFRHIYKSMYSWSIDPIRQWSRRVEYPFVYSAILSNHISSDATIVDAGSGFTFFPFFLEEKINAQVICVDSDVSLEQHFRESQSRKVKFVRGNLDQLTMFEANTIDIVYCISVLEHCANKAQIVKEFHRILKKDGLLILTCDISLDGKAEILIEDFRQLAIVLSHYFDLSPKYRTELDKIAGSPETILSTRSVRTIDPNALPWRMTLRGMLGNLSRLEIPRRPFSDLTVFMDVLHKR